MEDLEAISQTAVATKLPTEEVARYVRTIQNIWGGSAVEAMDTVLRIANRSPASFRSLGSAVQYSGQAAKDAGLSLETYMALLAGMAGAGRDVESVSQGLVGLWGRLAKAQEGIGRGGKIVIDAMNAVGAGGRLSMDQGQRGTGRNRRGDAPLPRAAESGEPIQPRTDRAHVHTGRRHLRVVSIVPGSEH